MTGAVLNVGFVTVLRIQEGWQCSMCAIKKISPELTEDIRTHNIKDIIPDAECY